MWRKIRRSFLHLSRLILRVVIKYFAIQLSKLMMQQINFTNTSTKNSEKYFLQNFSADVDTSDLSLGNKALFVTPRALGLQVTTYGDCRLAPKTNTSLSSALWPHSCALGKTFQEVTHLKVAPYQARLIVEFLVNGLP